jgi:WD40 repeat protein
MPTALANLFFFAQILFSLGVGFLLARRDRLSGLLVALPAVPMCWSWIESDVIDSAIGLPLFIGAGLATALTTAIMVRSGHEQAGIRLALLVNLLTRLPFTYARLYHHDYLLPPTTLEAIAVSVRDVVIGAILVTGPLWGWALWEEQGRRLVARGVRRGERAVSGPRRHTSISALWRALRGWWLIGALLAATGVLVIGAHPCGWLDVALNVSGCQCTLEKHESPVQSVAFSPDGALLASASGDGTARLWQVADRTLLYVLEVPTTGDASYSHDVAFSPDGTTLAFGLTDGSVRLWRVSDGTLLRTLRGNADKICSLAFSPDGRILASGSWDSTIRLWEVANGTPLRTWTGHEGGVLDMAFSPDGSMLASASFDGTVRVWRAADGTLLYASKPRESVVEGVAFSPDGSMLAVASWDGWVQVWSVGDWRCLRVMESESRGINDLAFSPGGTILVAGDSWHRLQWWRVADGTLLHDVGGHENTVESVAFSPDGDILASGSLDGTVRLWRIPEGAKSEMTQTVDDLGPVQISSSRITVETGSSSKPRSMKGYELYSWQTEETNDEQ